jgi:VIT1/CCC1 family predicted Fe2+/Mn2+ transporter
LHKTSIPYLLRDRLYVNFSDPSQFSLNVSNIAKSLLENAPHTSEIDAEAVRKASIDAKRAFLEMAKAQHTIQKANEVRSVALAVTASVISVIATAAPWVFAKGLTYTQLGSYFVGLLMLVIGFAFGRFSKSYSSNRYDVPGSRKSEK